MKVLSLQLDSMGIDVLGTTTVHLLGYNTPVIVDPINTVFYVFGYKSVYYFGME